MIQLHRYWFLPRIVFALIIFFTACIASAASQQNLPSGSSQKLIPDAKSDRPLPNRQSEEIPDWQARWELARLLSYVKKYDEALLEYRKLLDEKPGLFKAKVEMARVLFWIGKTRRALELIETLPADRLNIEAQLMKADIYFALKKYEKAEPIYRSYLKTHPKAHSIRLKLAEMLSWVKRYEESINEFRTILKDNPEDIQIRRKYAFVLMWAGRRSDAIKQLKTTLDH
jgi:thioredoxin-like negative regulator of GroEL